MNTVVLLLSCIVVVAVSTNPTCDFSTIDTKGNIMIYNPSRFAVPNTETQLFVVGTDGSAQTQKIFLNVCGDASLVGCTSSTPICQKLSNTSYASFGPPSAWKLHTYIDPVTKVTDASAGIYATMVGGDVCADGKQRSAHLWLKCDPNVQQRPLTVTVRQADPRSPSVRTPCDYYFDPIAHADFCHVLSVNPLNIVWIIIGSVLGVAGVVIIIVILSCCFCKCCPCYGCCRRRHHHHHSGYAHV